VVFCVFFVLERGRLSVWFVILQFSTGWPAPK